MTPVLRVSASVPLKQIGPLYFEIGRGRTCGLDLGLDTFLNQISIKSNEFGQSVL